VLKTLHYKTYLADFETDWIIFIHGAGGSVQTWNFQIDELKKHYNLLLIDLRDHGGSKNIHPSYKRYNFDIVSRDVLNVLEKENVQKAHFVTLSFGSVMMQAIYKRKPDVVMKMVFIGGIFNANLGIKAFVHLARFLNLFLSYKKMYQIFSFLLIPKKEHQMARRIYQRQARTLGAKEYLKWLGLYSEFFLLLKSFHQQIIDNPMLILMGTDDYLFLPSAKIFTRKKDQATLKLIPGAGHICNIDKPHETNQAILTFLGSPKDLKERQQTTAAFDTGLY